MTNLLPQSPMQRLFACVHAVAHRWEKPHSSSASHGKASDRTGGWSLSVLSLPAAMLVGWLVVVVAGDGRLDALGNPVGGDYAMFHIAGEMAAAGEWTKLYDEPAQQRRLLVLFPELPSGTYLPYRYPPLVAILVAPLTGLPYAAAFMLFTCLSVSAWLGSWWLLVESSIGSLQHRAKVDRLLAFLVMAPIAMQTIIDGQASLIWFAIAATCWSALVRGQPVCAGAVLGLAACKPNVMLLLGLVWVIRYPRMLLGIVPTGLMMLLVTLCVAGSECLERYVQLARELASSPWQVETPYWKVQSLLSWSELWLGDAARRFHLILGVLAAVIVGLWWRKSSQQEHGSHVLQRQDVVALTCGLAMNTLLNLYTPVYDWALLQLGVFVWLVYSAERDWLPRLLSDRWVRLALVALWIGPILSQALSKSIASPLQVMPLVLLAIVIGILWCHYQRSPSRLGRLQHSL